MTFLSVVITSYFHRRETCVRAQELCESRGGRPGLPVPNSPYDLCGRKATLNDRLSLSEPRSREKVEVAVLGSPSPIVLMTSVESNTERPTISLRAQEP